MVTLLALFEALPHAWMVDIHLPTLILIINSVPTNSHPFYFHLS